jgi:hypothetical protein
MGARLIGAATAALAMVLAGPLVAQQRQVTPGQPAIMDEEELDAPEMTPPPVPAKPSRRTRNQAAPAPQTDPDLDAEDQLAPSQMKQQMPSAVGAPTGGARRQASHSQATPDTAEATPPRPAAVAKPPVRGPAFKAVACGGGAFAKDSSSLKIASIFDSRNITFTEVDVSGTKVGATIVYPKDPKKRLEIWWNNPGNRSDIYLILINGQSTWSAPGGMRLGLTLAELEKLNHKPFKIKGFDKDGIATISDWDGGALATLQGGCKSGVNLRADPKVPADTLTSLAADHEYSSDDAAIRAAKPSVSEILIGY